MDRRDGTGDGMKAGGWKEPLAIPHNDETSIRSRWEQAPSVRLTCGTRSALQRQDFLQGNGKINACVRLGERNEVLS
jgi:hypothetical protein